MANIFISYRREDSGGHAGRLCDRLTTRFGDARVFMDLQDIGPGQNFAQSIDERIATCDCVVAVIGPRWVETIQKRASDAEDFVQHEISAALKRGVTVIPVLVGGARMPSAGHLPPAMSDLRLRNALEIRDERFDADVALLGDAIGRCGAGDDSGVRAIGGYLRAARVAPWIAGVGFIVALAAAYAWLKPAETVTAPPETATASAQATTTIPTPAAAPEVAGDWIAEMQKEGQPAFRIRLTFVVTGDNITGMVRYPTGDAPILDAHQAGASLTFYTSHIPQFESTPAIIRYQAAVDADEIRLTTTDDYGITKGIARRRPSDTQR